MLTVLVVGGIAGAASLAGGFIALARRPTSIFLSIALGFASGVLVATITLEMLPEALELGAPLLVAAGFATGVLPIYGLDLFVNRGWVAGEHAEQRPRVDRIHRSRPPRGSEVSILAGGTTAEEIIEGISIGVAIAIDPRLAIVIGASIAVDNLSEGLSIGSLAKRTSEEQGDNNARIKVLGSTGAIGAAVFLSSLTGWLLLRGMPDPALAFLLSMGASGMLYLTVTDLIPAGAQYHFEQSSALAASLGFLAVLVITSLS